MTIFVRSNPSAQWVADTRLARPQSRVDALRAAIAEKRYRIDPQAIASRLIAAIASNAEYSGQRH